MTAPTMQCGRCGAQNVAGDQFCGSCGAFLEWVTDPAAGAGVTPAAPIPDSSLAASVPVEGGLAGLRGGAGAAPDPGPSPTTAPTIVTAPVPPPSDSLVRCPACGIANPADRTFCVSCGTTLAQARGTGSVGADWAGLPPAAPTTPGELAGTPQVGGVRAGTATKGGSPGWILGVALVGVLVGVVLVGGSMLLGQGAGPSAEAGTVVPSPTDSTSAEPSSDAPPTATPAPTKPPKAVTLKVASAKASTVVGNRPKFDAGKAIDGNVKTAWQEGAIDEAGQWIEVTVAPASRLDTLVLRNGYQLSTAAFLGNRRLRDIRITIDGGSPIELRLKDSTKDQRIDLKGAAGSTIRIEIVSTYSSRKTSYAGSPYDDASLSEITVIGVPAG